MVTLASRQLRDKILGKTKKLKETGAPYGHVYVKKDVHPSVRNGWKRYAMLRLRRRLNPRIPAV